MLQVKSYTTMQIIVVQLFIAAFANADIHVRPLEPNPGIYYESQGNLRLLRSTWRLIISLNASLTFKSMIPFDMSLQNAAACGTRLTADECYILSEIDTGNSRMEVLFEIDRQIKNIKDDLRLNGIVSRNKRSFDIISNGVLNWGTKAVKGLFGTLTSSDLKDIYTSVADAIKQGYAFLFLRNKKTHVYTKNFRNMENSDMHIYKVLNNTIYNLTTGLQNLQAQDELLRRQIASLTLIQRRDAEYELAIQAKQTELEVLTKLQKGDLDARLIDPSILPTLKYDIRTNNENFEIPLPEEHFRPAELIRISHLDATIDNNQVIIVLSIPLVEKAKYTFYKLHPIPVYQRIDNQNFSVQIKPSHNFLAIGNLDNNFVKFDSLNNCLKTHFAYLCNSFGPLQSTSTSLDCEVALFLSPEHKHLKSCSLIITPNVYDNWRYLQSENVWLFATHDGLTARQICPDNTEKQLQLNTTSVIEITDNCMIKTNSKTIFNGKSSTVEILYKYYPQQNLNFLEFIQTYHDARVILHNLKTWAKNPIPLELKEIINMPLNNMESCYGIVPIIITCIIINVIFILIISIIFHKFINKQTKYLLPPITYIRSNSMSQSNFHRNTNTSSSIPKTDMLSISLPSNTIAQPSSTVNNTQIHQTTNTPLISQSVTKTIQSKINVIT